MSSASRLRIFSLGPLEQRLLSALWRRGSATVRELIDYGDTPRAYTTVMTTLNRLYKKKLLDRILQARAFRYIPCYTQPELEREMANGIIRHLLDVSTSASLPLSCLVETISKHDVRLLDDLQHLVDEKLHELQGQVLTTRNEISAGRGQLT
jgi:predicted transcriptional regulator